MFILKKIKLIFLFLIFLITFNFKAFAIDKMDGTWFECEFSGKITKPSDDCEMLDNDGFIFSQNKATHISVIDSQETNCKKNKVGQCFKSNLSLITAKVGREDKIQFEDGKLILSFLLCDQVFHLKNRSNYVEASPDSEKCFWTGEKVFYLKKYNGELILKK